MKISVIVPIKDNLDISKVCLDNLIRYTVNELELIIVNEGSTKDTTDYLESLQNVIYIKNETPLGWCKAINQGLEKSTGDYIVFANNDTVVTPDWDKKFLAHFEVDQKLGVLGPITNKVDGFQNIDYNNGDTFQYTDVVTFFFVMIRRDVITKIGGLDERFGLGGQDDADYSIRARQTGYRVGIARDVFIYHYGSATFRNEFKNDIPKSSEYAKSRVDLLRDKHRDINDTGVKKRIFIAVPNMGNIVTELAINLIQWSHDPRYQVQIYAPKNMFPLDNARNHTVKKFLQSDYDLLWWIDDDITPPVEAMHKLASADKDAITAAAFAIEYKSGSMIPYPVTLRYNADKKYEVYYGTGIEEIDATGGACVMVKRKVYEAIERPYEFQYYRDGTLSLTCDFDVWQKAQKAGFTLWADWSILCSHLKEIDVKMLNDVLITVASQQNEKR